MRKKRVILLCLIGAALALTAFLAYNSTPAEPSYDGHPLSFWVVRAGTDPITDRDAAQMKKAEEAFDHIGVAALPFLIKWLQYKKPPQWRATLASSLIRMRFPFGGQLSDLIINRRAIHLASGTAGAFDVLGTRAMPAFNDLCRLMNQTNAPLTAHLALFALSNLGTNALPPFLAIATNTQSPVRLEALGAIHRLPDTDHAAAMAVPALIQCLSETNEPQVQENAAYALGDLTVLPQISIPALVPHLKDPNARLRQATATALGQFGPEASNAISALTNALTDPDPTVRRQASQSLHQIDPATFTNGIPQ